MVSPLVVFAAGIRDYSSHRPPTITLPTAGKSYIDPVFGSKIIRVTDASWGTRCYNAYSYWPAFNADSTRLLIACDGKPLLLRYDRTTDVLTPDGVLWGSDGEKVFWEGAVWSNVNPNTIFALDQRGTRLWKIDVSRRGAAGYTLMKDFSSKLGASVYLDHLTMSEWSEEFAFMTRSLATSTKKDVVMWDRMADRTYVMPRNTDYAIVQTKIDKRGERVMVNHDDETMVLWTPRTGDKVYFHQDNLNDNSGGHWDIGRDFIMNSNQVKAGIAGRTFDHLKPADNVVKYLRPDGTYNWTLGDHVSLRLENEEFFIASTYLGDGTYAAFENEIFLGYTDGHGFVRLGHTRSTQSSSDSVTRYRAQPRAVVDRKGRLVVYTSSLGSSTRTDVMILKIPSEFWPD